MALNGQEVGSWQAFEEYLKLSVGKEVVLDVERDQHVRHVTFTLPIPEKDVFLIDVASTLLGVALGMDVLIESVVPDSPAEKALLKAGDKVIAVNGEPVYNISTLIAIVGDNPGQDVNLQVMRDGSQLQLRVTPQANDSGRGLIGVRLQAKPWDELVWQHKSLLDSVVYGFTRTWEVTVMTGEMIKRMLSASISADNIGGPIAIAQMAGNTANSGMVYFIMFLAFFSVNLAILNLLPIPVLDGGVLMFLALEQVRGKPLSVDMQVRFQAVGMLLIMALMVFAFYNDIMRLF